MIANWQRVTRTNPCPICRKTHWCLIGQHSVICMRVISERAHNFEGGDMGWYHSLNGDAPVLVQKEQPRAPTVNVKKTLHDWSQFRRDQSGLAIDLGVSMDSLVALECTKAPDYKVWAFPMRDGYNEYTGIRLRHENGDKWAVTGSHAGIFIPQGIRPQKEIMICEGPTDAAAALTLGFYAVGRPSCSGGVPHISTWIKRHHIQRSIIVADNDDPGLRGADMLTAHIGVPSAILVLPAKDVREFLRNGGTKDDIRSLLGNVVWRQKVNSN